MDCRTSVLLTLALLTICAGCKSTRIAQNPGFAWFKKSSPEVVAKAQPKAPPAAPPKEETASLFNFTKADPKSNRRPKPATCVAWAVFRERAAKLADSDAEKQQLLDEARKAYQQALEAEPKNLQALAGLARVYTEMGKDERALEAFAKVVKDYPKEAGVWFTLGEHYKMRKDWGEAAKSYYQAHQLDPENRKYMQWLGFSLASAGQMEEAYTWLAKANSPATAHYNLAQLYRTQGNEEQCRKHLREALETNPGHAEATALLERINNPQQATPLTAPNAIASQPASTPTTSHTVGSAPPSDAPPTSLPPRATTAAAPPPTPPAPTPPVAQIGFAPEGLESLPPEAP